MNNKISINKIIADIKATKGNRSGCQGLSSTLESDGYITTICKWVRATSPDRINALVEHVEKQDAALIAWEKTMMEVCGEDGPASVASEIRALQVLRDTAMQALKSQIEQLAAENVGLKALIPENWNMHDALHQLMMARPGGVYFNKWEKLIAEVLNAIPATDRIVAGIKADGAAEREKTITFTAAKKRTQDGVALIAIGKPYKIHNDDVIGEFFIGERGRYGVITMDCLDYFTTSDEYAWEFSLREGAK